MSPRDVHDETPRRPDERDYAQRRAAELEAHSAARYARLSELLEFVELARQSIQPPCRYVL